MQLRTLGTDEVVNLEKLIGELLDNFAEFAGFAERKASGIDFKFRFLDFGDQHLSCVVKVHVNPDVNSSDCAITEAHRVPGGMSKASFVDFITYRVCQLVRLHGWRMTRSLLPLAVHFRK